MRRLMLALSMVMATPCAISPARAAEGGPSHGSVLAFPLVNGMDHPDLLLAQRTIERHWGPSDDSTYHEINVQGWKSEGGAFAMSLAIPGVGQLYVGERIGYAFLLTEAVGLYQAWAMKRSARDWDNQARAWAGNPADSLSRWSFDQYERQTQSSSASLRTLYAADPGLFYAAIGEQPGFTAGWADPKGTDFNREQYVDWRHNSEERFRRSHNWRAVVWINHTVAAFEALREARIVNLPLRENMQLHLKPGWSHGGAQMMAVLEQKF
jgi:hypothetical protein